MNTCRTCGKPIVWAHTAKGKAIPLDAAPCDDGNLVLVGGVAQVVDMFSAPGERWKSHFASCPDADEHRRRA